MLNYNDLTLSQRALYDHSSMVATPCGPSLLIGFRSAERSNPNLTFLDDDWRPVSQILLHFCQNRMRPENVPRGEPQPRSPAVSNSPRGSRDQTGKTDAVVPPVSALEARIRELTGTELSRVAKLNNVNTEVHLTNPGITSMRRKNALLALHKRGAKIRL